MNTLLWIGGGLVVAGLLWLLYSLCRASAGRLTIDQGEAFGGDYDADRN